MCEQILKNLATARNFRVALLRYFNACGADPDGQLSEQHDPETHLIPLAIDAASGRGPTACDPPLQIFGADYPTGDGTCQHDFIHVSDLATARVAALNGPSNGSETLVLNLGTGRSYSHSRNRISHRERVTGQRHPVPVIRGSPGRPGDPATLVADASRAERILHFKPNIRIWKPSFRRHGDRARSGACSKPADFPDPEQSLTLPRGADRSNSATRLREQNQRRRPVV